MFYHFTIMSLCEIFGSASAPAEEQESTSFQPRKLVYSAMDSLGSLILLYRGYHGWKSMPAVMMHYLVIAGMHSVLRLRSTKGEREAQAHETANHDKWRDILAACVSGLWHMSLGWPVCRFFLRSIQFVVRSSDDVRLALEVSAIFTEMDSKFRTPGKARPLLSGYIVHQMPDRLPLEGRPIRLGNTENLEDVIRALDSLSLPD